MALGVRSSLGDVRVFLADAMEGVECGEPPESLTDGHEPVEALAAFGAI